MNIEQSLSEIIKGRCINIMDLSRKTEIPYMALYDSLFSKTRNRELRSSELVRLCIFLDVDPRIFSDWKGCEQNEKTKKEKDP